MARNGSGTYNLPAGNPVTTGTTISSTWANTTLSDMATALTGSVASDGQTTPSANLPMGGFAHTNVGNATVRAMYPSAGQVQDGGLTYLTTVSGADTITAVAAVGMTAYATGQQFTFVSAGANTGAATININSIGAKSIVKTNGSALTAGDIASGAAVQLVYDGTNFQFANKSVSAAGDVAGPASSTDNAVARFDSTTGKIIQNSGVIVDDTNNVTGVATLKATTTIGVGGATPSASGAGITFPATQSASTDANTLDDYEEGTWTPVLKDNLGNTATMSVQQGFYTKTGNIVNVWWQVEWTNKSALVGTYPVITGLPFTAKSNTGNYGYYGVCVLNSSASNIVAALEGSTTNVSFATANTNTVIQVSSIDSTGRSMCSLTYFV